MPSVKTSALACVVACVTAWPGLFSTTQARAAERASAPVGEYSPPHNALTDQQYWIQYPPTIKKERVLQFPEASSLGEFRICPAPPISATLGKKMGARGRVVVPAKWITTFVPGKDFYLHPEICKTINPLGIDRICLNASSLDDSEDGLCDRALSKITSLQSIVDVSLDRSDATDSGAKSLALLPNVQHITAVRGSLEGACLKDWSALKNLHSLRLDNCPLASSNFQYFAAMPALQFLSLERCGIKDAGMRYLGNCKYLTVLTLTDNFYVNDANVGFLKNCQSLHYLNLTNTSVTAAGIMKLAGMKFYMIFAPDSNPTPAQKLALNKAFPGTYFVFQHLRQKREVDHDDKVLFAPLH